MPGLWGAGLLFFGVNCWILGVVVRDIGAADGGGGRGRGRVEVKGKSGEKVTVE